VSVVEKRLPEEFEDKKISLKALGVGGFAWKRGDLLRFLVDPQSDEFAILGGDVLECNEGGELSYTYDSWSAPERPRTEAFPSFCRRSKETALRYIQDYPPDDHVLFAPVISAAVTSGWES
jgi:hypothetical protein